MINVFTGRCDDRYGVCLHCGGALANGHVCKGLEVGEAILEAMQPDHPTKLAKMVKLWIAAHNIEQTQLAKEWGTPTSVVSRFLNGKNMPDGKTTARIISWLLEP